MGIAQEACDDILFRQIQLEYSPKIDLSLDRLVGFLDRIGNPHLRLPPVIHVAGTNGKGSTCAFMHSICRAAGWKAHVYTSPHLVQFRERYVVSGEEADPTLLDAVFRELRRLGAPDTLTLFEAMTAAAFLIFAANPADVCILEVGLGGRLDATNVVACCAAAAITSISLDHQEFLGHRLEDIALEKAGIIKPGSPVVTGRQEPAVLQRLASRAGSQGSSLRVRDVSWRIAREPDGIQFSDEDDVIRLPEPALKGRHQLDNLGIALGALRAADFRPSPAAIACGVRQVVWPGRLQRLDGALSGIPPTGSELWVDGAHNPGGAAALAAELRHWDDGCTLIVGMKSDRDPRPFLETLWPCAENVFVVSEPGQYDATAIDDLIRASGGRALSGPTVPQALRKMSKSSRVVICGSLYLVGEVLKMDRAGPGIFESSWCGM
ncbi:bifunctional folylpolyglutamate synthase/dihydrofolate synthase [Ancylobacter dichloromethanicus]|uniref:Dihydrofolate synthase/folylpolyglutamate synthase n=1 Tax=Ancylobacter dichloromethanicus TaxID=518825 RepID=A0A9W6N105_9HYPH|nr:folylpolyglutamate synthase/dihydrofolate synthase family protein [Ancylobacter dichloromethanicus]MBS7556372.1 bifunctional folylpolyglutamate synthase/dihydrofolate synthase [Ancylobacter dichloromethanicus]GLK73630.1 bifunctional folylpolyglutamate synthase/dihydrofolate synthase [Ancylobacter dichloromethanicus]